MLTGNDWTAKWIEDGKQQPARDEDYYKPDAMPLFYLYSLLKRRFLAQGYTSVH